MPAAPQGPQHDPAQSADDVARERLETWAALLGHWTAFARAGVGLPKDAQGERWRSSIPAIIGLQGITMALGELDLLAQRRGAAEYAVGVDRAAVSIREHTAALNAAWRDEVMPPGLAELMEDASAALDAARHAGVELCAAAPGAAPPSDRLARDLLALDFKGDLFVPPPGTRLDAGAPLAFLAQPNGSPPDVKVLEVLQNWGPPGATIHRSARCQPLLIPAIERGRLPSG